MMICWTHHTTSAQAGPRSNTASPMRQASPIRRSVRRRSLTRVAPSSVRRAGCNQCSRRSMVWTKHARSSTVMRFLLAGVLVAFRTSHDGPRQCSPDSIASEPAACACSPVATRVDPTTPRRPTRCSLHAAPHSGHTTHPSRSAINPASAYPHPPQNPPATSVGPMFRSTRRRAGHHNSHRTATSDPTSNTKCGQGPSRRGNGVHTNTPQHPSTHKNPTANASTTFSIEIRVASNRIAWRTSRTASRRPDAPSSLVAAIARSVRRWIGPPRSSTLPFSLPFS